MSVQLTPPRSTSAGGLPVLAPESCDRLVVSAMEAGLREIPNDIAGICRYRLGEHLRQHATAACEAVRRGAPPTEDAFEFSHITAQRWAHDDVPLAALLAAYRAAESSMWNALCGAGMGLTAPLQIATCRVVAEYFDAAARIVTGVYLDARASARSTLRTVDDWIARLVTGERVRESEVIDLAGYGLERDTALVVGVLDNGTEISDSVLAALSTSESGERRLVGRLHGRCVCVAPRTDPDVLLATIVARCGTTQAGVSTSRRGFAEIPTAYAEARRALRMTTLEVPRKAFGAATLFDDLLCLADRTTQKLIPVWAHVLDQEDRRSGGELLTTLRAYADEELTVSRVARRLGVHPNTVRYRLHRIETATGRSVKSFHALFEMLASLSLLRQNAQPS